MIRGGRVVLNVTDVGRSVRFYVETLGMKLLEESEDGSSIIDAGDGFSFELRKSRGALAPSKEPTIRFFPKVGIDEAIAIFENRGVEFRTQRGSKELVASFLDPDGNILCLAQSV